jgi:hypothetical protein
MILFWKSAFPITRKCARKFENSFRDGFNEKLLQFAKKVESIKDSICIEEATKTSFIMPFFKCLDMMFSTRLNLFRVCGEC